MNAKALFPVILIVSLLASAIVRADDPQQTDTVETKLRQAYRDIMLQLRDAQNQVITLQATQAQDEKDKADLQAKVDLLTGQLKTVTDQAAADKSASDKEIADLKSDNADQMAQIGRLNDAVSQWKTAWDQANQLAIAKEAARASLELKAGLLQRTADERETQNLALFQLGNEILTRYERFGLGDALSAKEPFVGISRVKLENLVQDYKYKLLDHAVTTTPASPGMSPARPVSQGTSNGTNTAKPVGQT
jgi:uncharacterized coiled-coil protein SlyX